MAYPSKFKQLEQEHDKPIAEILRDLLNEFGSIAKVARVLDMGYNNVFHKVKDCGIYHEPARWKLPETAEVMKANHSD